MFLNYIAHHFLFWAVPSSLLLSGYYSQLFNQFLGNAIASYDGSLKQPGRQVSLCFPFSGEFCVRLKYLWFEALIGPSGERIRDKFPLWGILAIYLNS